MNTKNLLLTILLVVGLCAAAVSFRARFHSEARNRAVELVIDWSDAQALANTSSQAIDGVLRQLHAAGITTVAVTEETLETLHGSGIVNYKRIGDNTELTFAKGFTGQEQRVIDALNHKTKLHITPQGPHQYMVDAPWPQFNGTPIGLDGDVVKTITGLTDAEGRSAHLLVAPRLYNFTGVNEDNIRWELAQTKDLIGPGHLGPFIFAGAAVLGNRSHITDAVHAFQDLGLTYGTVEFAKTLGDEDFSRAAAANTVRVHSIGADEMGTMEEPTAIERFVRGARERNIRVCYVRLFTNGLKHDPNVLHANVDFVQKIVAGMKEARLSVQGPAHPFGDPDPVPGRILRILMSLGISAGIVMLILAFTGSENRSFWPILITTVIIAAGLAIPSTSAKGREILALLAACTFPTLALCGRPIRALSGPLVSTGEAMRNALREYVRLTLVTFGGVLFVVGLLSGRLFFLKVDEFLGVKAVLLVPIVLVAAFYFLGLADLDRSENWATRKRILRERLGAMSHHKLEIGQIVLGIVVLAVLLLLAARSGNDPGVGVSPLELKMRALLDKYLLVRPRTKEFLLGHPAMFIGLTLAYSRLAASTQKNGESRVPKWVLPSLIVIGAIGQSSLLDTFCHLHTPLYLSLLRATIGWALGGAIGAIVYAIFARYFQRQGAMPITLDGHVDEARTPSKQETLA